MKKQKPRNYFTYYYKIGKRIKHGGMTDDLERREKEHQQKWPRGHIFQVGYRKTKKGAERWEKKKGFR